ncbi:MAG: histidinol-phosphate aminotransferase family protein [Betaproteobacteria bacterium]|nr:histidinol-phosphate aminotransferase family protein [Betaproteobacteria bacterium]
MYKDNPALGTKEAYVPGLTSEYVSKTYGIPIADVAKLGSAENPFGPSPMATEVVMSARKIENYPDWTAGALREKIASKYGYKPEQVICGAGETEIIPWIIRAYSSKGDKILMYVPAFPIYHMVAENEGRVPVFIGMGDDLDFKWDDYIAAIKDDVRIVFLTNPHSPTGRLIPNDQIRKVCRAAKNQLVVLDEAYIHFSKTNGGMELLREFDNLIVMRTFSKVYGLAGLRIGFGISTPEIITPLMHLKPTWNMGALQTAGAVAALDDDAYVKKTVDAIAEMREYVVEQIGKTMQGRYTVVGQPSSNFFMLRIEDPALDSTTLFNELLKRGVIVKDGSVSFIGLGKRYMRIDVSLKKHMDRLLRALSEIQPVR